MFSLIIQADLVVCDITAHNANVFYELGIRHALRTGAPCTKVVPSDNDAIDAD
jgi:hypothetical protein